VQGSSSLRETAEVDDGDEGARVPKVHIHIDLLSLQSDHFNGVD
jgi:hypothetical protein